MMAVGIAALLIGYSLLYTGSMNLMNGGNGPTLWTSLGITGKLDSPGTNTPSTSPPPTGGNQSGQPPSFVPGVPESPFGPI